MHAALEEWVTRWHHAQITGSRRSLTEQKSVTPIASQQEENMSMTQRSKERTVYGQTSRTP